VLRFRAITSVVNRYYDPVTDQFLSVDLDVAKTDQPYAFANDNPLNSGDPLGDIPMQSQDIGTETNQHLAQVVATILWGQRKQLVALHMGSTNWSTAIGGVGVILTGIGAALSITVLIAGLPEDVGIAAITAIAVSTVGAATDTYECFVHHNELSCVGASIAGLSIFSLGLSTIGGAAWAGFTAFAASTGTAGFIVDAFNFLHWLL
jgi:hypothetical protein